ncbi:YfhO family protein [Lentilactobacillus sp. Marseille-Q4993]|uniref:YfhO family protein n=1 Tax=Lentilactobacillus sp. Marseille-Q4993 TaxID=3039492 RepID=UPI0024BCBDEE|nr:YfhO family protein [Lentilactobacillus sp. Marseille-Q4993]
MKKLWQKTPIVILYTGFFILLSALIVGLLYMTDKSAIWQLDGLTQHYPILTTFRQMIIDFIHNPAGGFNHWSWNIGLGSDTLTNLSYYVTGDLFNYLIVFFPKSHLEMGFAALIFLRMFVSGLAFLLFTTHYNFSKISRLIGTLSYVFSGYALATGIHHPFFILPLIFFPLLVYGIDNILLNKSMVPLALAIFLVLIGNFYFAWILAIGAAVYTIVKVGFFIKKPNFIFLHALLKTLGAVVIGLGMSAVIFLPTILLALNSTRIHQKFANGFTFFPIDYYLKLPSAILQTGRAMNFWLVIGITSISFLGLVYMLIHFKTFLEQNIFTLIILIGILIPAVGAVINAFSTPSNRWILLGNLLFGMATMVFVENITNFTRRDVGIMLLSGLGLIAIIWLSRGMILRIQRHDLIEYGFLLLTLIAILAMPAFKWSARTNYIVISLVFLANVGANIIGTYSPNSSQFIKLQLNRGLATRLSEDYYNGAEKYTDAQKGFFRTTVGPKYHHDKENVMANYTNLNSNAPMNTATNDESVYLTLQNGYLGKFARSVGNSQFSMNTPIAQNDYRTSLNNLLGVKYIFAKANTKKKPMIPYGYTQVKNIDGTPLIYNAKTRTYPKSGLENQNGTTIYQSKLALPLIYSQTQTVSPSAFNRLSSIDKERVMTQGAVVDSVNHDRNSLQYKSPKKNIDYQVKMDTQPIIYNGDQLTKYRLHVLDKGEKASDKALLQPHKNVNLGANLTATKKVIQENRNIITSNATKNSDGLKEMTADATGAKINYQLDIKKPATTKNSELFLVLKGIHQTDPSFSDKLKWDANNKLMNNSLYTKMQKLNNFRHHLLNQSYGGYQFDAFAGGYHTGFTQYNNNNLSNYRQINDMVINLGYSKSARKKVTLMFNQVKNIKFKSVKLVAMPFNKAYNRQLTKLKQTGLTNLRVDQNEVTGESHNATASTMVSSIPYSSGWKLSVDGKDADTFVVNKGFVGASLPAGKHDIKLVYSTPGGTIGKILSLLSTILLIILCIVSKVRSHSNTDDASRRSKYKHARRRI